MEKIFIFGIDGAIPEFFFGEWLNELPNIKKLVESGGYAKLNSTIPPLSITAWTSIVTGKNPADTGIFEYSYRENHRYDKKNIFTALDLKEKTFWQVSSEYGKNSVICYPILSWPIKHFNGHLISGALTPSGESVKNVYPLELKKELQEIFKEVPTADVPFFRDLSKEEIIEEVLMLTKRQIEVEKYLLKNKDWDLFFVLIGLSDRMNHSFWKYMDKKHRKYETNNKFENVLKDYYKFVDGELGEMLKLLDENTKIIVLSDHGITRMHTRINLTDWLIKEGYMTLKEPIKEKIEFNFEMVDWNKTKAFAIGAYEGQIFLNLKGREPEGIVDEKDHDNLIKELSTKLKKIKGEFGEELKTEIFERKKFFQGKRNENAPDLMVYFDGLEYGCNTSLIGNETLYSPQTAKGSDDAGHSKQGIFIIKNGKYKNEFLGEIEAIDVAPTILDLMNIKIPEDMKGKII